MRDELYTILNAPRETENEIREVTDQIYTLMWSTVPGAIRYDVPRVQTSPEDRMAETFGVVDELRNRLLWLCKRKRREEDTIRRIIMGCVDLDPDERKVLRGRYLDREPWAQIAGWVNATDRRVYQIHRSACDKLEAFLWPTGNKMQT